MTDFNISFTRVDPSHTPTWDFVCALYDEAFPPDERRDMELQRHIIATDDRFHQMVIHANDKLIGIISYWNFGHYIYAEHLAIDPNHRCGGIGAAVLNHFFGTIDLPLLIEVEHPTDSLSTRRIGFYQRLGFTLSPIDNYVQPAYSPQKSPIPMRLMTRGAIDLQTAYPEIVQTIRKEVYKVV